MMETEQPETGEKEDSGIDQSPENTLNNEPVEVGADSELEEPTSLDGFNQNNESEDVSSSEDQEDLEEQDFIPDWLRPEFLEEGEETQEVTEESEVRTSEMDIEQLKEDSSDKNISESEAEEQETAEEEEGLGELGWLEQIASGAGASLDETPTMSWDEQPEDEGSADADEEEMTWLDEMDTEKSMPLVAELEHSPSNDESANEYSSDVRIEDVETPGEEPVGELPEDPDEVMAWLENLAARQGADPEELPSYAADLPEPERAQTDEIPEDPDEAMAWLEKLSALEEPQLDDSLPGAELPVDYEADESTVESPEIEPLEDKPADAEDLDMPDDLSEALMWLEEIVEVPPEKADTEALIEGQEEEVVPEVITDEGEVSIDVSVEDEEVEEAMEWLEQLAARQGAAPDELTSVIDPDADVQATEWLEVQEKKIQAEEPAIDEYEEAVALEVSDVEEEIEGVEPVTAEWEETESVDEETLEISSEAASDEVPEIATEPASDEDMAWLETLGSVDAEGWLDSEAEAVEITEDSQISRVDSGIMISEELAIEHEQEQPREIDQETEVEAGPWDSELLEKAHAAIKSGDIVRAAEEYAVLLEQDIDLNQLITDIETTSESFSREPVLQRLLGDAYRKNGQSQEALEVYRKALDNL